MEDTIIKALLLGYAHIECNGTPIRICLKKAQGLLFYLLVHKKATRDELTGLLWGGEDNELARRHLRDNLYHLKKVVPIELVVPAGRSAIQLNPELGFYIDVDEFLKAVDVEAYQGEFLKGFSVPNCYEYEEWLERTRTSLREAYLQQLDKRAEFCLSEGKDGEAEALWRKYLQEEPLCETVSISLMRFYRAQKDYNRAALIYRGLHKAMADTLGIAPLKDTSELYYSIMKEWNEQSENGEISDDFLVGRQNQLQYLLHLFSRMHTSKHARSFVILGEAGVGKTHLLSYFLSHGEVSSYAINRRYNGYLLVMEGRYEDAREELLRTLVLLHDSAEDEVERRLQSAYAHDYIGEAYRKQGMYARAIEEYQIAIDMIGEYPTSTSTPIFYVDWAMASLAIGDYAAAHNALSNSNRAADNVKEPTGYFRTLYCACNALMCFADGDYRHCASEILQCEQLTKALIVPYDTGILYLTKALLCCYSAQLDIAETPLADVLTEDIAYYCAHCRKCMAGGKAGAFEQELLKRLECGCSDPLPGFLQVTKN